MRDTFWLRVVCIVALLAILVAGVQTCRLRMSERRDLAAMAKEQGKTLVDAGWLETTEAHARELEALVPSLKAELAAAKKSGVTVAGTSHWTGTGREVAIPCTVVMGPPAGVGHAPTSPASPPAQESEAPPIEVSNLDNPTVGVTPHVRIEDAVAIDDAGGIYLARKVEARLSVGESWMSEWAPVTADEDSVTRVDQEIRDALKLWKNPPYRFEALFGPSMGTDGAGVVAAISGGRGWLGWFAQGDYVIADPGQSRVAGGLRIGKR